MNIAESESQFYSAVTRVSMAHICQSVGYKAAQTCALNTISDIAGRYLRVIGEIAAASANSAGRSVCNLPDIVAALEDLGSVQGFIEAHELKKSHCLMSSSVLKDVMDIVLWDEAIPFSKSIPQKSWPELKKSGNAMGLSHVPRWLPEMPVMREIEERLGTEMGKERIEEAFRGEERTVGKVGSEKRKGFDLPEKRGKVKFTLGKVTVDMEVKNRGFGMDMEVKNSGIFSRSGKGKRILCQG